MKRKIQLACYVFDTIATHTALVNDVTNTDACTLKGSNHSRVFATFKRRFFNKQNLKSSEKVLYNYASTFSSVQFKT